MNIRAKTTYKPVNMGKSAKALVWGIFFLGVVNAAFAHNVNALVNEYLTTLLPLRDKVKTVCIDPGHGGHDPGCHGSFVNEKNVALAIGLKLGNLIETYYPDVKVVYTRKTDVFVELHRRAEIANKANADLFICIHCNAAGADAHGAETYALGLHKTEANLAVAKRENEAILLEDDYKVHYEGFDVNSPEGSVIFSFLQNTYLNRSLSFASKVQHYFKTDAGRYDRGVKQAGFLVLWKTAMPSVLIETGFLTNKNEEKYMMEPANQLVMATAIFKAFTDYKNEIEGTQVKHNLPKEKQTEEKAEMKNEDKKLSENPNPVHTDKAERPVFKVQFYSGPTLINNAEERFRGVKQIGYYKTSNGYCYTSGESTSVEEMKKLQNSLRSSGYPDAFVVAFFNKERISVKEALEILNKNP
ncbi:MAG: N-acetylmuramoyl-L-alanine amidase [Flavobacteriales bacterium]|nr:N-acetylmuramoyl-L-alanine amidase [Flavobacteriales bacterium]